MRTPIQTILLVVAAVLAVTTTAHARSWRIHNEPDMAADFMSINGAMDSDNVADGDTLYIVSGCSLTDTQTVTKKITLIGPGFLPDESQTTSITGTICINADSVRFESINTDFILIGADHVTIERCQTGHILWSKQGHYLTLRQSKVGRVLGADSNLRVHKAWTYYATIENCIILFNWYYSPVEDLDRATIHHNYISNEWSGSSYLSSACLMYSVSNSKICDNILMRSVRPNQIFISCSGNTVYNNVISSTSSTYPSFPDNIYLGSADPSLVFSLTGDGDEQYRLCDDSPARGYASDGGDCGPYGGDHPYVPGGLLVANDRLPKLNVSVSKTNLVEGDTFTLTVKADSIPKDAATLMLICDNSVRFDFPSKLTLSAGETTVTSTITVIDDNDIADTQSAAFTVSAEGYETGEAIVVVNDDDMPNIELALAPTTVSVNAGANAIMGTIKRSEHLNSKLTVVLSDDADGLLAYSPQKVTLERGATEAHFTVSTNGAMTTDREVHVTAAVYVKTCDCPAGTQSGGSTTQSLTLLAGEGAVMTIEPLTTDFPFDSDQNGFIVKLESPAQQEMVINVTSDFDDYLEYEHAVTVPAGETTITVPVIRKSEADIPEGQVITFTASAAGYATAACWAIATESSKPDALITSFEVSATEAEAGSEVELTIVVKNAGSGQLSEDASIKVSLSDGSYPIVLKTDTILSSGESTTITTTYQLPPSIGDYAFQATVNPAGKIDEVASINNVSQEIPIAIKPSFQVTAATDKATYGQGEVITVTGTATGSKSAFVDVEVYFINDDMRQTVTVKTDAKGNYSAVFLPLDGTSGHFAIGACFPGEDKTDAMAEADVYGLIMKNHRTTCQLSQGSSYNGTIIVSNTGNKSQTGLRVLQQDASEGCTFSFSRFSEIEAGQTLEIPYTINTTGNEVTDGVRRMNVSVVSNEGALTEHSIDYTIEPAKGCLKTDSTSIVMTMTQGVAREFPITIWNEGLAPTGTISLTLPSWIQSITPQQLPSIASGDSVTVVLRIEPTDNMYLNIPKTGRIGMNCTDGTGLSITIEVTPVLEENGTVTIDVLDEFTYCTEEKPHVSGAKVRIVNIATQTVVVEGVTNAEGILTADLLSGWYRLKVTADYHEAYDEYLLVDPGTNKTKRVFISFNGITTEWKVEETEVEDEYSMETVVKFETQVPPPYIDVIWPDKKPQQGKYFPVTLVNKGLIDFFDVKTKLNVTSSSYDVEIMGNPDIDTLKAGQAAVLYARLTAKNRHSLLRKASEYGDSDCLNLTSDTEACYECYETVDKNFKNTKTYGKCRGGSSSSSSGSGGGGSGGGGNNGNNNGNTPPTEKKEEIACELPIFKIVTVDTNKPVLGVATDGVSKVKIVLDGEYDQEHNNKIKWGSWEIVGGTNLGGLECIDKSNNPNPLEGVIYTAPDYFPDENETVYKVRLKLPYTRPDKQEPEPITVEVELIRVPVLMVHGLNSSRRCWDSMKNYLKRNHYQNLLAIDYSATNKNSFEENKNVVYDKGIRVFLRDKYFTNLHVVSKVDIVAHSMGGLLTKMFLKNHPEYRDNINKFITINTPHGGSQLGNFMNDPKINFIHEITISEDRFRGSNPLVRYIIRQLFNKFYPHSKGDTIKDMRKGAVADLSVGGNGLEWTPGQAIAALNQNNITTGVNCHAIVTSGFEEGKWQYYEVYNGSAPESEALQFVYDNIYGEMGYDNSESFVNDIFNGPNNRNGRNDMVVSELSQMGGITNISWLPKDPNNRPGDIRFSHTETCSNEIVQQEVLRLLNSTDASDFSNGFGKTPDLEYKLEFMTWEQILREFPYVEMANGDDLFNKYVITDIDVENPSELYRRWVNKDWPNNDNARKIIKRNLKATSTITLTHSYTEGDTLINIKVIPDGEFSGLSLGCFYDDHLFAYVKSTEEEVRLPNKVQGNIVVLCAGRRDDGTWCVISDTIAVNTIGNTTMQKLSFVEDSVFIINDDCYRPSLLCTWSDGVVTEVENPTLSVTNGNLAYIEDNKYVYGKHTGHTNLVATYGDLTCSTPLEVYITDEAQDIEDKDDADTRKSVCSTIELGIDHKSVMTRQAFRGTLTINNNHPSLSLQNLRLRLEARDEEGKLATQHEFQIAPEALNGDFTGELDFDTGWDLKSGGTGVATVLFIPTKNAAPTEPKRWSFGGTISYTDPFTGLVVTHSLKPVTLTVNPTPVLDFTYFLQRDAFGDDPMTSDVSEKSLPFEFALLINNKGNADAKNLKFVCKSPKIEENDQGLTADIRLLSAQLNGEDKALTLSDNIPIEVGTVAAQSQTYVQWWMASSLLGHFIEYDVSFDHKTSYGNEELSLIDQVSIHELIRGFTPPLSPLTSQYSTSQRAFLVNDTEDDKDMPDRIYFTDATQRDVTLASEAVFSRQGGVNYMLSVVPSQPGWTYAVIDSPIGTNYQVARIIRQSDGVEMPSDNIWITDRTLRDGKVARIENKLHFIGEVPEGGEQFQIIFEYKPDLLLKVVTYEGVPAEDVELECTLTEVTLHFNKPVFDETFTLDDLTLFHDGTKVDLSTATITKVDNQAFKLNLGTATSQKGYYALMVNTHSIVDSEGFEGTQSKEASWTQKGKEPEQIEVTDISQLADAIYINPVTARIGGDVEVEICLKNGHAATAYLFDLVLPEGVTVATNSSGKYIDVLSDRHDDHSPKINYGGNNTYSLSTLSGNSEELTGNDGVIRRLTLHVADYVAEGSYAININRASYAKSNGTLVKMLETTSAITVEDYVLGDVNGNGQVDIGDAVSIVNFLVGKESQVFVQKAADTNRNGQIDIGDAVTIVNFLVGKTARLSHQHDYMWYEMEPQ